MPSDDLERKMYWMVNELLEKAGYIHYEISNYAKPGFVSKHNLDCWNQKEYIGFGLAAHSYINGVRYCNSSDMNEYMKLIKNINEVQTEYSKMQEFVMLALRKIEGVSKKSFKQKFNEELNCVFKNEISKLKKIELIEEIGDFIRLSKKGIDLANVVWAEFI